MLNSLASRAELELWLALALAHLLTPQQTPLTCLTSVWPLGNVGTLEMVNNRLYLYFIVFIEDEPCELNANDALLR